jgi:steroid delta-isomerase-like uncharacterized protein
MSLSSEDTVQRFFAAYNAHDLDAITELLADDFVYADLGMRSTVEGKDQVVAYLKGAFSIPDLSWRVDSIFSSGDRVAVESTYFATIPPGVGHNTTNDPLAMTGKAATIIGTRDGLMARLTDYHNPAPDPS